MRELTKMTGEEIEALSKWELIHAKYCELDARMSRLERKCVECHRSWTDESERWRTYLTGDDELALYCPECAAREFGGDDA